MKVLWLEDHPELLQGDLEILKGNTTEVTLVTSVARACRELELGLKADAQYTHIIIDIHVPEVESSLPRDIQNLKRKLGLDTFSKMNGLPFALYVKDKYPDIKAVFYTLFDSLPVEDERLNGIPFFDRNNEDYQGNGILKLLE